MMILPGTKLAVKMAERGVNILRVSPLYAWDEESGGQMGYLVEFEYKFKGYIDREQPHKVTEGWRKTAVEFYPTSLQAPTSLESAIEHVYSLAVSVQDSLAKPFAER